MLTGSGLKPLPQIIGEAAAHDEFDRTDDRTQQDRCFRHVRLRALAYREHAWVQVQWTASCQKLAGPVPFQTKDGLASANLHDGSELGTQTLAQLVSERPLIVTVAYDQP